VLRKSVIPHGDPEVPLPMNLLRLTQKAQGLFPPADDDEFGPVEVITGVKALLEKLIVVPGKDGLSEEAQRNATVLLFAHIRSALASKRVRCLLCHDWHIYAQLVLQKWLSCTADALPCLLYFVAASPWLQCHS
jgi:RNA polymerase Rpb1, domain 6